MHNEKSFLKGNDYFIFGVITAFAAFLILISLKSVKPEAALLPKAILYFMPAMSVCMIIDSIFKKYIRNTEISLNVKLSEIAEGVLVPGLILVIASLSVDYLGFYLMAFLLIIAIFVLQSRITESKYNFSLKKIVIWLGFSAVTTLFMFFVFNIMLNLPTPRGIFGF
jgi:hypothetical protein